ncbi:VOC family protein [Nonomuraea aridisoli]|uniref:Bleomycin resistance protein n=1 Tax=Nonomuraea aridisoli TaxID=2070368 RepID=A0A2W2EWL2_9ACTN|nr:VOC family protein [Nonomuraea aridisoli]PZG16838.1 bleomycin resistance protein [Nonomuraea aridisoli]
MSVQLNHTIVAAKDRDETAAFLVDVLGLEPAPVYGPFRVVTLSNGVSLDVVQVSEAVPSQHYAFLVSEEEFDAIWGRIKERGLTFWADPHHQRPGQINTNDGGRGLYWSDPNGHNLEIITVPYGGG